MSKQSIYNILAAKSEPVKVELTALSDLKDLAAQAAAASLKAGTGLDSVITGLAQARKIANTGLSQARRAVAVSKDLGIDTAEFEKLEQMFSRWYDDYENSIKLVQQLQNRL